ncbi:hypothetical protein [Methanocella arvoryzae]|nr:hypothetical protein [Methanocella arvoryzae]
MRNCYNHPGMGAIATCEACGRGICALCATNLEGHVYCRDCAEEERKNLQAQSISDHTEQAAPAAAEPAPAPAPTPKPAPAPVAPPARPASEPPREKPAPAPAAPAAPPVPPAEPAPPAAIVPAKPTQIAPREPATTPAPASPPATGTAGKPAEKESLISALLSFVVPGLGQVYNGHIKKGIVLAVLFYGLLVVILACIVLFSLMSGIGSICCAPALLFPALVLLYSIYDAYQSAEKINRGEETRDWL